MRTSRSYYEILGIPRDATLVLVKRRYKQLVKKYHPDVAADQQLAHRLFLQIREAYEVLSDPVRRRDYDASLDAERARVTTTRTAQGRAERAHVRTAADLIRDAQFTFIQRRFTEAAGLCKDALRSDPRNARAHAVLGDIYRVQGKASSAMQEYSYAIQYDPSDRETERKLTRLMGKVSRTVRRDSPKPHAAVARLTILSIWWSIALFLVLLIGVRPGSPVVWLSYYVPWISKWSWSFISLLSASSIIIGALLSVGGLLRHPDEELVFESGGANWAVIPTGLILIVGSLIFFPGAAAAYLALGLAQGSLSRSVLNVFAAVAAIVLVSAVVCLPAARFQVLLFGGNLSFMSMLIGWYAGSMFKPLGDMH